MSQERDPELDPDHWVEGTPEPIENSPVVPATEQAEHIEVKCQGCETAQGFDIDSKTEGFTFKCPFCRTTTAWTRA